MEISIGWVIVIFLVLIGIGIFGWIKWFEVLNSPDGERYQKMRTQGPFVPVPPDEGKSEK